MANKRSSKKDIRRTAKRTLRNKEVKSALKTYVKKARQAIHAHQAEAIVSTVPDVASKLDKAVQRGIIHPNQAARRKSRIAKQAAAALKAEPVAVVETKKPAAAKAEAAKKPAAEKKAPEKKAVEKKAEDPKKAPAKKPAAKKTAE